jgi:hypothetical protein
MSDAATETATTTTTTEGTVGDVLKKDGVKIVQVKFANANGHVYNSGLYAYYTNLDLKEGDLAVVHVSAKDAFGGYKVVKVASTEESVSGILNAHKWIISKVDVEAHEARMEREKRRAIIEAKLVKAAEVAHRNQLLTTLATHNPEINDLLAELKGLEA